MVLQFDGQKDGRTGRTEFKGPSNRAGSSTRSSEITLQAPATVIDFLLKWFKFNSLKANTKNFQSSLGK